MATTRVDALNYIAPLVLRVYQAARRGVSDSPDGLGPSLDEAFRAFGATSATLFTTTIPDADDEKFRATLRYQALDLVEWDLLTMVDNRVDAPTSDVKWSQMLKAVQTKKAQALAEMGRLGIAPVNTSWARWTFDHLEDSDAPGGEF